MNARDALASAPAQRRRPIVVETSGRCANIAIEADAGHRVSVAIADGQAVRLVVRVVPGRAGVAVEALPGGDGAAVDRPIVCTSGNLSEEPMATTTDEALRRLAPIADLVLTHDRGIVRPVDVQRRPTLQRRSPRIRPVPQLVSAGPLAHPLGDVERDTR